MFVDLPRSAALSSRLDPEEMHEVFRSALRRGGRRESFVSEVYVSPVTLCACLFRLATGTRGRGRARGTRCSRNSWRASSTGNAGEADVACRIGIATGSVVVGDIVGEGAAQERAVAGDTPNLAARLQAFAQPGSVVAESTRQLLGDLFEFEQCGPREIRGIEKRCGASWSPAKARQRVASRHCTGAA